MRADALIIMLVLRHTDPVTRVMAHTDPVMPVPQGPSRSRLAIGRITLAAPVIMWARRITSGSRDIGDGATITEFGSTAATV